MFTTTSKTEAIKRFEEDGGYLLDLGGSGDERTFCVCDEEMALDLGRTKEHLASLSPAYSEVEL